MDFDEWYKNIDQGTTGEELAEKSWRACKIQVLQILIDNPRCDDYYYDLVDKIEKL